MANYPTITYSNVKHKVDLGSDAPASSRIVDGVIQVKDEDITPIFNNGSGTSYRASYNSPYNQITGNYTPNKALSRFEIRVNPVEIADYGPGIGNLAYSATNIANGTLSSFTINITQAIFTGSTSNTYRICLMAQSSLDRSWDFTQLYMVVGDTHTGSYVYKPTDSDGYDVHGTDVVS